MEMKRFMVTYEIRNIVRAFTVDAINESYALDASYCENAMGEDGEDTYKVHSCMEV